MNKQRYLAELQRLLVFMSDADRAEAVRRYAAQFDAVGPEGESELIALIGSPTKAAIGLSRGYEPGKLPDALPGLPELPEKPKAALTEDEEDPWGDLPTFDLPEIDLPEEAPQKPGPDEPFSIPDLPGYVPNRPRDDGGDVRRGMPLWLGIPLFIILFAAIGLPLGAVCIAVLLALMAPGAAVLFGAYLIAVGALWCLSNMADAILLFGAAFIVLAFGLILLFGGLWLGVKLFSLYVRGVGWLAGRLIKRRVAEYA